MKIITWNCNGALRNKFQHLSKLNADIIVIQECEDPNQSANNAYKEFAKNSIWLGSNKNKGIGVFAKQDVLIEKLDWSNIYEDHEVNFFLPILINKKYKLLALWAHHNNSPTFEYIGQVWKYLKLNHSNIDNSIIIGDFNSNTIWDKWDRWWNHTDVVKILSDKNIHSVYHHYFKEEQGKESLSTFYLQRNINKSYHIDYCFLPIEQLNKISSIEVGSANDWLSISDHVPLILSIDSII